MHAPRVQIDAVSDTGRGMAASMLGDFYPYYLHPCFHSLSAGPATDNVSWGNLDKKSVALDTCL